MQRRQKQRATPPTLCIISWVPLHFNVLIIDFAAPDMYKEHCLWVQSSFDYLKNTCTLWVFLFRKKHSQGTSFQLSVQVNLSLMSMGTLLLPPTGLNSWLKAKVYSTLKCFGNFRKGKGNILINSLISSSMLKLFFTIPHNNLHISQILFPKVYLNLCIYNCMCWCNLFYSEKKKYSTLKTLAIWGLSWDINCKKYWYNHSIY